MSCTQSSCGVENGRRKGVRGDGGERVSEVRGGVGQRQELGEDGGWQREEKEMWRAGHAGIMRKYGP